MECPPSGWEAGIAAVHCCTSVARTVWNSTAMASSSTYTGCDSRAGDLIIRSGHASRVKAKFHYAIQVADLVADLVSDLLQTGSGHIALRYPAR